MRLILLIKKNYYAVDFASKRKIGLCWCLRYQEGGFRTEASLPCNMWRLVALFPSQTGNGLGSIKFHQKNVKCLFAQTDLFL